MKNYRHNVFLWMLGAGIFAMFLSYSVLKIEYARHPKDIASYGPRMQRTMRVVELRFQRNMLLDDYEVHLLTEHPPMLERQVVDDADLYRRLRVGSVVQVTMQERRLNDGTSGGYRIIDVSEVER